MTVLEYDRRQFLPTDSVPDRREVLLLLGSIRAIHVRRSSFVVRRSSFGQRFEKSTGESCFTEVKGESRGSDSTRGSTRGGTLLLMLLHGVSSRGVSSFHFHWKKSRLFYRNLDQRSENTRERAVRVLRVARVVSTHNSRGKAPSR